MFKLKYDDFLEYDEATGVYTLPKDQQVRDEHERNAWKANGLTLLRDWRLYLMLVPMLLVYLLWRYMPMTQLLAAFKNPKTPGVLESDVAHQDWFGLTNFNELLFGSTKNTPMFWAAFRNTFAIAFYGLVFGFPFPIILAIFFNEIRSNIARSIIQVCVYLPKFMSTVIITTLAIVLFKGPANEGVMDDSIGVLSKVLLNLFPSANLKSAIVARGGMIFSNNYFRALFEITGIWEHGGYDSIVFFAAVIAVSPTSYEAAQIDGAGKMQQMRYVVLPSILSTVVIMLIMKVGSLLSVGYEKVYLMSSPNNYGAADIVATLSNRWNTDDGQTTLGIAAELLNNFIGMILVLGANAIAKRASDVSLY